jgi:hypothetical protein
MTNLPASLTDLINADYAVKCFSGETRMQSELSAAFDMVANKETWKLAIDAWVDDNVAPRLVADAVVHFTGSKPEIRFSTYRTGYRVTAPGYYAAVGA